MNIQNWKYKDKSQGGQSYYYATWQGYNIEVYDINGGMEIGIYSKYGTLKKPPFRLEIPISEFVNRYESIMICIQDLLDSIT